MKTNKKSTTDKAAQLKEITEQLEKSVKEFMEGDKYKNFLAHMAKFHTYSLNNQLLIASQRPDATLCASYNGWLSQHRYVKKGEKGIKIICPVSYKTQHLKDVIDPDTKKPKLHPDGSRQQEIEERVHMSFKVGYTYDVSQTDGEPLPEIARQLEGDLDDSQKELKEALLQVCPVPVSFQPIKGSANGYYNLESKEIVIDSNLSERHTLKTLIHEMAHALLHDKDTAPDAPADSSTREVQAESIACVVCQYCGLDTSDYSFGYISGWSSGKDTQELRASFETIRNTSNDIITKAEAALTQMRAPKPDLTENLSETLSEALPKIHKGRCM